MRQTVVRAPRVTWWEGALWAGVLLVSAGPYLLEAALEHFLWHLVYGSSVGVVAGAAVSLYQSRPPRRVSLWALGGYIYMVVPDILWAIPLVWGGDVYHHQPWMDVFLGHVFLDTWAYTTAMLTPTALVAALAWMGARVAIDRNAATPGGG